MRRKDWAGHDYGSANQQIWNSSTPPTYHVRNMTSPPTAVIYGSRDALADPQDVAYLLDNLRPQTLVYQQEINDYAHLDFVWGLNAYIDVYPTVLTLLSMYRR